MSSSVNPVFPSSSAQSLINSEETRKIMDFLSSKVTDIFKKIGKAVPTIEITKELFKLKKETAQATENALLENLYCSFFDKNTLKIFVLFLHKLPRGPIKEGLEYIKNAPGYSVTEGFQVPNDWKKNETVILAQIYKEQFFAWILKNSDLPFDTILLMLQILQSFDDPSIQLDNQVWNKLSLGKEKIFQRQLKEFQCKYEFLTKNKFLQSFPLELKDIKVTCDIEKSVIGQYRLWRESIQRVVHKTVGDARAVSKMTSNAWILGTDQISWENVSDKVLARRLKKALPFFQEKITTLLWYLRDLEEKRNKQGFQSIKEKCDELLEVVNIHKKECDKLREIVEMCKQAKERGEANPNEELWEQLQNRSDKGCYSQETSLKKDKRASQSLLEEFSLVEEVSLINFLMTYMNDYITREQLRSKQEREGLSVDEFDEMLERQFEPERKHSPSKNRPKQHFLSGSSDEEELSQPVTFSRTSVVLKTEKPAGSVEKLQIYLENREQNKQLNGCLSQTIDIYLQQMKPYLRQKQGKEVHDHVLLGAAALEHMAQAIQEGRKHHITLGFRSALIHCHFAIEQVLYQIILKETGLNLNSHNLIYLAEQLEENTGRSIPKEIKDFLEEIRVHLWFHYPEDYRLYFAYNKTTVKAFSLLDKLSQSKISRGSLKEVVNFSFEKYCQTLEFITELLEVPMETVLDFRNKISRLESQLNDVLSSSKPSKSFTVESSLIQKIDEAQQILNILTDASELVHIKDFEEGWLLVAFNTIKSYLQIMKIALETPQESTRHSLQKFIQVETLLNMDKLFKHLFRAISILHLGEDNRAHDLKKFFSMIEEFYQKPLFEEDKKLLESINLGITHHYLHKGSNADLKKDSDHFLVQARALLSTDEGFTAVTANGEFSHKTLHEAKEAIMNTMELSLDLFINLLHPVIGEMEKIDKDIEEEIRNLQR